MTLVSVGNKKPDHVVVPTLTLSHFENGYDVNAYFIFTAGLKHACSFHGNIYDQVQNMRSKYWPIGRDAI